MPERVRQPSFLFMKSKSLPDIPSEPVYLEIYLAIDLHRGTFFSLCPFPHINMLTFQSPVNFSYGCNTHVDSVNRRFRYVILFGNVPRHLLQPFQSILPLPPSHSGQWTWLPLFQCFEAIYLCVYAAVTVRICHNHYPSCSVTYSTYAPLMVHSFPMYVNTGQKMRWFFCS